MVGTRRIRSFGGLGRRVTEHLPHYPQLDHYPQSTRQIVELHPKVSLLGIT